MIMTRILTSMQIGESSPLVIYILLHNTINEYLTKIS